MKNLLLAAPLAFSFLGSAPATRAQTAPAAPYYLLNTVPIGPTPAPLTESPRPWPSVVPGTLRVLEFGR